MTQCDLTSKRCVPCEGGVPKLTASEIEAFSQQVSGWVARDEKLHKTFTFKDFLQAMAFINAMAEVAEAEGHHPDFKLYQWNRVDVVIWTHAIGGLSENDFILAAKIDELPVAH